jgi:hypothetical protein
VKMRKLRDTIALVQAIYHCWRTPVRCEVARDGAHSF